MVIIANTYWTLTTCLLQSPTPSFHLCLGVPQSRCYNKDSRAGGLLEQWSGKPKQGEEMQDRDGKDATKGTLRNRSLLGQLGSVPGGPSKSWPGLCPKSSYHKMGFWGYLLPLVTPWLRMPLVSYTTGTSGSPAHVHKLPRHPGKTSGNDAEQALGTSLGD